MKLAAEAYRKLRTLITQPTIALEYLSWLAKGKRNATRQIVGVTVGGFVDFSEYHCAPQAISSVEERFLDQIAKKLPPGAIVDVGANLGIFSLFMALRLPERRVAAFEPMTTTYSALLNNVARNAAHNVRSFPTAVSDREGRATFLFDPRSRATASQTAVPSTNSGRDPSSLDVDCTTLDKFRESGAINSVAFLKIDVEGFEEQVVRGAERILRSDHPIVYFEVCPSNAERVGQSPDGAARFLIELGYRLYELNGDGSLRSATVSRVRQTILANWVAIEQSSDLRDLVEA